MMADAREALAERFSGLRESLPDLERLVLFGSAATGRARPRSDLDLAVSCEGPADLDAIYLALAGRLRTDRLDLVDLRRAGPLLAFQIARTGLVLFERFAGVFRQFQSLASRPVRRHAPTPRSPAARHPGLPARGGPRVSPVDAAVIRRELGRITASLAALRPLARLPLGEYRQRRYQRKAAERLRYPRFVEAVASFLTKSGCRRRCAPSVAPWGASFPRTLGR